MEKIKMDKLVKKAVENVMNRVRSDTGMTLKECYERQIPKKPDFEGDGYCDGVLVYDTWICPCCGQRYEVDYDDYKHCPKCGQAIYWSE